MKLAVFSVLLATVSVGNAFVITFDNSSNVGLFTEGGISGGTNGAHTTADGVGTPDGALAITGGTEQFNYNASTFNLANGSAWTVSSFVNGYTQPSVAATQSSLIGVGFVRDQSDTFAITNNASTGLYARVANTGMGTYQLQMINKSSDAAVDATANTVASSAAFNLVTGNWYQLSLTLVATSLDTFSYSASFLDYGTDGVSAPTTVATLTGSTVSANVYGDTTMHAGIVSRPWVGDPVTSYVDNFAVTEVIPEPSALMLAMLGLVPLVRRKR